MHYIERAVEKPIGHALGRGKSVLLLGPRQTGKTTMLDRMACDYRVSFAPPSVRQRYEQDMAALGQEIDAVRPKRRSTVPLILLDEIQKIPEVMDLVQDFVDRKKAQFILTGSSARKLRQSNVNLLPGRVISLHMDPLTLSEYPKPGLTDRLLFGSLPIIYQSTNENDRQADLRAYVTTYLEEEIRAEALVRNVGMFGRFLELAAAESGMTINFRKLSQVIGVAHTTLMDYYQILEDCLVAERVEPYTLSKTRKKLTHAQKYLFFDLGVRRVAAKEGTQPAMATWGSLFEQWVGLELIRIMRLEHPNARLRFWRDPAGPEVDWVIQNENKLIPIEVKWSESPTVQDAKHLATFLSEYPQADRGYIISRAPRTRKLTDRIFILPWRELSNVFES